MSPRRAQAAHDLLAQLASGESAPLGERIVSRRRALLDLRRAGLPSLTSAAYLPTPLDGPRLQRSLGDRALIDLRWSCPSTMDALHRRRSAGPKRPLFILSEYQWAGRGRHGRHWLSPLTGNYYIGLRCDLQARPAELPALPLMLGVAIADTLRSNGVPAELKWPNDVVVDGRKLGGLLVELTAGGGPLVAHIGVGLNWRLEARSRSCIDRDVIDLHELLRPLPDRNALLIQILNALLASLTALQTGAAKTWLQRWRELDSLNGQRLRVQRQQQWLEGNAESIDAIGRLQLRLDGGELLCLDSGEVERVVGRRAEGRLRAGPRAEG